MTEAFDYGDYESADGLTHASNVESLIWHHPGAIDLTIQEESLNQFPAHLRDIDNRELCETIFEGAYSFGYLNDKGSMQDHHMAFLTGVRWSYSLMLRTGMPEPPRLRSGFEQSGDEDMVQITAEIIDGALDMGLNSEYLLDVQEELLESEDDPERLRTVRLGFLVGLYLIEQGEYEKDDLSDTTDFQSKPIAPPLSEREKRIYDQLIRSFYNSSD